MCMCACMCVCVCVCVCVHVCMYVCMHVSCVCVCVCVCVLGVLSVLLCFSFVLLRMCEVNLLVTQRSMLRVCVTKSHHAGEAKENILQARVQVHVEVRVPTED